MNGIETEYIPTGRAVTDFPCSADEIAAYDVVVLSDIGFNTLALPPQTFTEYEQVANRLQLIEDFVAVGGGLLIIGGYLSIMGFNGKALYKRTPVERALPVTMQTYDDRVERSDGVVPIKRDREHPVVDGLPEEWPALLNYNRVEGDDDADELARVGEDPLLAVSAHGDGRSAAFTGDYAPQWGASAFTEETL